jgi:hypothetical protein
VNFATLRVTPVFSETLNMAEEDPRR